MSTTTQKRKRNNISTTTNYPLFEKSNEVNRVNNHNNRPDSFIKWTLSKTGTLVGKIFGRGALLDEHERPKPDDINYIISSHGELRFKVKQSHKKQKASTTNTRSNHGSQSIQLCRIDLKKCNEILNSNSTTKQRKLYIILYNDLGSALTSRKNIAKYMCEFGFNAIPTNRVTSQYGRALNTQPMSIGNATKIQSELSDLTFKPLEPPYICKKGCGTVTHRTSQCLRHYKSCKGISIDAKPITRNCFGWEDEPSGLFKCSNQTAEQVLNFGHKFKGGNNMGPDFNSSIGEYYLSDIIYNIINHKYDPSDRTNPNNIYIHISACLVMDDMIDPEHIVAFGKKRKSKKKRKRRHKNIRTKFKNMN